MRRGIATFTLDEGRCPKWLFERMVNLGGKIIDVLIDEFGPDEFIMRISDTVWFQSIGTVLAFDWNASGLTTILTAALKEAVRGKEKELGIFICGGKGKTSRKTPQEIESWGERLGLPGGVVSNLKYNSKMAAKVDSSMVQDGFQIYHHSFFFSKSGTWAVIQQGMNIEDGTARRYHWFSEDIRDLVCEPHKSIVSDKKYSALNLTSSKSKKSRDISVEMVLSGYPSLMKDIQIIRRHSSKLSRMFTVKNRQGELFSALNLENMEFKHHEVEFEDFSRSKYLEKILAKIVYEKPKTYESLVSMRGVGAKTLRALALVGEVIYGAEPSYEDPARYSFAFGGKDATPYPVDIKTYDSAIAIIKKAVSKSKIENFEKRRIIRRLDGKHNNQFSKCKHCII